MTERPKVEFKYDKQADCAYLDFDPEKKLIHAYSKGLGDWINIDFDKDGKLRGIELIDATQFLPKETLESFPEYE